MTLKGYILLGDQRRDISQTFRDPGAVGRTNFCRFETAVDQAEDAVQVVLEIEEAHHDVLAQVAHPFVVPGDKRSQSQIDGTAPAPINSVVKLQRVAGKAVQGLEHQKVLPSLWTAKSLSDTMGSPDGMHSFS